MSPSGSVFPTSDFNKITHKLCEKIHHRKKFINKLLTVEKTYIVDTF